MNAISIGPLLLAGDRLAAAIGIAVFTFVTAVIAARVDSRIGRWSMHALVGGFIAARLGHVIEYATNFAAEPWRVFAVWQGGFSWIWGAAAVIAITLYHLRTVRLNLWAAFALAVSLVAWNTAYQLTSATATTPLPSISLKQLNGGSVKLERFKGKPLVINLWATWCPPCRDEMPMMAEVAAATDKVTFLFINHAEMPATIKAFLDSENIKIEHVLLDPNSQIAGHYKTRGLPMTLFIGADGLSRVTYFGEVSREALSKYVSRLLEE